MAGGGVSQLLSELDSCSTAFTNSNKGKRVVASTTKSFLQKYFWTQCCIAGQKFSYYKKVTDSSLTEVLVFGLSANPYMTLDTYIQRTELFFNMSQISSGNVIYAGTPKTSPKGMVQCINSLTRYNALQEKIIDYGQMNKISSYSATCKATRHIDNPPSWYDDLPFNYDGYHPSDDDINDTFTFTCTSSDHILWWDTYGTEGTRYLHEEWTLTYKCKKLVLNDATTTTLNVHS